MLNVIRFLFSHPLTRDAKFKALLRFFSWQIKCRLKNEIIVPWVGATKLSVRRSMRGATGNIYAGLHEFVDMIFVLHFLRPGDLFLDIGSNIGSYTVLASGACGAETWAFEPDPETAVFLRKNLEINALNNITQIFEHALGSTEADIAFTVGRDTENRIADPGDLNVRTVQQRTLDTITGDRHPIMMKLDVEGSEDAVLQGAAACISKKSLLAIQAESVSEYFEATLNQEGFRRAYYDPYRRELSNVPTKFLSANTLFVRDEQAIAERLIGASKVDVLGQRI